jgi:diguanylate cyclase (GGDEF)-like protein/PAS domain S-box-containing protein
MDESTIAVLGLGPAGSLSRAQLEHLCVENLLASPEERVYFKDLESRFLLVSQGWIAAAAPGCTAEELVGKSDFDIFSERHAEDARADELWIIRTGEPIVAKIEREPFYGRPDAWVSTTKLPLRNDHGAIVGTYGISRDVTLQVLAEEALAHQALHDPLTGLANRTAMRDRLSQALLGLERRPGRVAVLFIAAGDKVLVEVARRLSKISRRGDTVARLGGDEFVLLCNTLGDDDDVRFMGDRCVRALAETFVDEGCDLTISASIGIAVTNEPTADPDMLLLHADIAMYEAKSAGRNRLRLFDGELGAHAALSYGIEGDLRRALDQREFFVLYQPLFSLEHHSLRGAEALVRWQHPTRGLIPPVEFIPLAEERGLIGAIDSFVLDEACRQLATWVRHDEVPLGFTMAVNVSGRQLSDPALAERVAAAIQRHGIAPSQLCLEITETALIGEAGDVEETLAAISSLGVRLALDDFGTGYSTLAHLQRLKVDILKIDRSFIEQIGRSSRDHKIVAAVTAMAHALGMSVVAEGIETAHQLGALAGLGCDEGQGFLLARPVLPAQLVELYHNTHTAPA